MKHKIILNSAANCPENREKRKYSKENTQQEQSSQEKTYEQCFQQEH